MATKKLRQNGLLLVEILLAVALMSIITLIILSSFVYGRDSTAVAGDRSRAAQIANMTVEAVQNIAQDNYANLDSYTDSTDYFLDVSSSSWQLARTTKTIDSRFTSMVKFSAGLNSHSRQLTVTVSWQATPQRSASVTVTSYVSDWRAPTATLPLSFRDREIS
jgi:type II secretory pathway pseudopilin PulG